MKLFDLPFAKHFCALDPVVSASVGRQSLFNYYRNIGKGTNRLVEGGTAFEIHRVNAIEAADRWLVYSLVHYRRSLDMLAPASAPWAHVTLYYSSFFAANAILAMFGGWLTGMGKNKTRVVEVENETPGSQTLRILRDASSPSGAAGSHRVFWDFFYSSAAGISAWAPTELSDALKPVNGDFGWQTKARNAVNYDTFESWAASMSFRTDFRSAKLYSVTGPLLLQLEATERVVSLALYFADKLEIGVAGLAGSGHRGTSGQIQRRLVTHPVPRLVDQSKFDAMLER